MGFVVAVAGSDSVLAKPCAKMGWMRLKLVRRRERKEMRTCTRKEGKEKRWGEELRSGIAAVQRKKKERGRRGREAGK